eukprot:CAMPEP_0174928574 /NCGR_PEP_ID=MMETSP1355-20121228/24517_1 /TAXON_ID=464990 /ORGANISM="Hemiselmis tepida, Strain CCMP443" /LENGTH=181 /DNA_ID=CAMNT_0016174739 /DNA_START=44 /DNA_END=589 /DNA_ORIENTATION=+
MKIFSLTLTAMCLASASALSLESHRPGVAHFRAPAPSSPIAKPLRGGGDGIDPKVVLKAAAIAGALFTVELGLSDVLPIPHVDLKGKMFPTAEECYFGQPATALSSSIMKYFALLLGFEGAANWMVAENGNADLIKKFNILNAVTWGVGVALHKINNQPIWKTTGFWACGALSILNAAAAM